MKLNIQIRAQDEGYNNRSLLHIESTQLLPEIPNGTKNTKLTVAHVQALQERIAAETRDITQKVKRELKELYDQAAENEEVRLQQQRENAPKESATP